MKRPCILALDQGTTNSKAVLVDREGSIVASASRALGVNYPQPGWVEQDAHALWSTLREAVDDCLSQADVEVIAVGVSNQRETVLMWDRATGEPVGPCVIWQCRRSAPFCNDLTAQGLEPWLRRRTGLTIDPLFSAGKMRWLLDNVPSARARARFRAGVPLVVGRIGSESGAWPSFRMARASRPASRPCSSSDTVTEARVPWCTRSIQKLASGIRLCSTTHCRTVL